MHAPTYIPKIEHAVEEAAHLAPAIEREAPVAARLISSVPDAKTLETVKAIANSSPSLPRRIIDRLHKELRYAAGLEENQPFWGFSEPKPTYRMPEGLAGEANLLRPLQYVRQYVTSPVRYGLGKIIPTPLKATYDFMLNPRYPILEPYLANKPIFKHLPTVMRWGPTAAFTTGLGAGVYNRAYNDPRGILNPLLEQGVLTPEQYRAAYDRMKGWPMLTDFTKNVILGDDAMARMHRDILDKTLIDRIRSGLYWHQKQEPLWAGLGDFATSMTPAGAVATLFKRLWAKPYDNKQD